MIAEQLRRWIPGALGRRFFAVLATVDDEPARVGMLAINEFPANPSLTAISATDAFPTGRICTVLNMWTRPAYRRRGFATAVMKMLLDLGRERGAPRIELLSRTMALPLDESLGFTRTTGDHVPSVFAPF